MEFDLEIFHYTTWKEIDLYDIGDEQEGLLNENYVLITVVNKTYEAPEGLLKLQTDFGCI